MPVSPARASELPTSEIPNPTNPLKFLRSEIPYRIGAVNSRGEYRRRESGFGPKRGTGGQRSAAETRSEPGLFDAARRGGRKLGGEAWRRERTPVRTLSIWAFSETEMVCDRRRLATETPIKLPIARKMISKAAAFARRAPRQAPWAARCARLRHWREGLVVGQVRRLLQAPEIAARTVAACTAADGAGPAAAANEREVIEALGRLDEVCAACAGSPIDPRTPTVGKPAAHEPAAERHTMLRATRGQSTNSARSPSIGGFFFSPSTQAWRIPQPRHGPPT